MDVDLISEHDPTHKRAREEDDNASIRSTSSRASTGKSSRGPGRLPTTGEYVGLAAARAEAIRLEREELQVRLEQELLDSWTGKPRVTRARKVLLGVEESPAGGSEEIPDPSSLSAADLEGQLQKSGGLE